MESGKNQRIANAENSTRFGWGNARVGGHAVVMVEASFGSPRRDVRAAIIAEDFLKAGNDFAGARIARRNGAAGTGIAAFKIHFADAEADGTAFFLAKELVFPESGDAVDFERGAEALAGLVEVYAVE